METENIQDALLKELERLQCLLISFSGGIDSTVLALLAQKALQDNVNAYFLMRLSFQEERLMKQRKSQLNSAYPALQFPFLL
jgi:PP-loop superfamily ATP-utilizing enzyme